MKGIIARIREDDTEYDPLAQAAAAAGVDLDLARMAKSRVMWDGYYGPTSAKDWIESGEDERVASVNESLKILTNVKEHIEDYVVESYEYCDDEDCDSCNSHNATGEGHLVETERVYASEIAKDLFAVIYDIYGGWPSTR